MKNRARTLKPPLKGSPVLVVEICGDASGSKLSIQPRAPTSVFLMPPPSPAGLALQAIKNFRLKEIRAPRYKVLTQYRAPTPKAAPSTSKATAATTDSANAAAAPPPAADASASAKAHGQPNPFLPRFNVKTGRWAPAKYSLRAQAELIKKAKLSGTVALLPPGPKMDELDILAHVAATRGPSSTVRKALWAHADAVQWEGAPKAKVAGAEIGNRLYAGKRRMFKGHKWERTKAAVEVRRAMLLKDMPKRIVRYKGVSVLCLLRVGTGADALFSTITGGGRTPWAPRRSPRRRSCRSRVYRSCIQVVNVTGSLFALSVWHSGSKHRPALPLNRTATADCGSGPVRKLWYEVSHISSIERNDTLLISLV